jgi:hypothetical protein
MDRGPHVAVHARKKRSLRHTAELTLTENPDPPDHIPCAAQPPTSWLLTYILAQELRRS